MKTSTSEKLCSTCNLIKPISEYYKSRKSYTKHCKECLLIRHRNTRILRKLNNPNYEIDIRNLWDYFEPGTEEYIHKYVMEEVIPELNEIYLKKGKKY